MARLMGKFTENRPRFELGNPRFLRSIAIVLLVFVMVWNPLRLLKTFAHFEVAGPLSKGLSTLFGLSGRGVTMEAAGLDGAMRSQPEIWLLGKAADGAEALVEDLRLLGFGVKPGLLEPQQALVNVPLVVLPGTDVAALAPIEALGRVAVYQEATLIDFRQPDSVLAALWGSLDDGVMGGVSTSQVQWQNGLRFVGQVSTANSGGFASVRTRNLEPPLNLSQWQGTTIYGEGDGQRYKWILRDNPGWDSLAYCRSFDTEVGQLSTVRTPFLEMKATRRARTVPDANRFNPAQLYSMQLMLSKFEYDGELNPALQPGSFGLTVQRLGVYR